LFSFNVFSISEAHFNKSSISNQAIAIGSNQTAVRTEYLHQMLSGTLKVSNHKLVANSFKIHFFSSVIAITLFFNSFSPYFFLKSSNKILKVKAGSRVAQDLEITIIA